jgi:tetratricopeptide (TPR) repeat protein
MMKTRQKAKMTVKVPSSRDRIVSIVFRVVATVLLGDCGLLLAATDEVNSNLPSNSVNSAPPPSVSAQPHYDLARDCWVRKDYACALEELKAAQKIDDAPELFVNIGQVLVMLKRFDEALETYVNGLARMGATISPNLKAELAERIAELKNPVAVDMHANVTDANVVIDGKSLGSVPVPLRLSLAPGRHTIVLNRAGYFTTRQDFIIAPRQREPVLVTLKVASSEPERSSMMYVGWALSGALAVGSLVTGGFAWSASKEQGELLERYPVERRKLESNADKVRNLSDVATGLAVAATITAGVSLWFSLNPAPKNRSTGLRENRDIALGIGPTELSARWRF